MIYRFYSVWYAWTSTTNGVLHISGETSVYNFIMSVRAFRGSNISELTPVETTNDGGVPVTPGDVIAIQVASIYYPVWGGGGGLGSFTLTLSLETPAATSPNDLFAGRIEITNAIYHFDGSIHDATSEPGEPLPPGTSQTLWWKYTAPEAGMLVVSPSAAQFTPVVALYTGSSVNALSAISPVNNFRYRVLAGHEYFIQLSSGDVPGGAFSLDARFLSSTNDNFAGSTHIEGTNFTWVGSMTTATLEPGEPNPGYSNTIWMSWAAPVTGRTRITRHAAAWPQPILVYTGPTVDRLQPVRMVELDNGLSDFLAVEGTVYHFQLSGMNNECSFSVEIQDCSRPSNDFFNAARQLVGQYLSDDPMPVNGATVEPGEPRFLDGVPFKSLWWKWQAPVHGSATVSSLRSMATNVVIGICAGSSVEALTLLGRDTNNVAFSITGGNTYYIAAAVPADAPGDVVIDVHVVSQSTASREVPGNLLREPSWEGTAILNTHYWGMSGSVGGAVNELSGCDGMTWPSLSAGAQIWQDIPTVPGRNYLIRLAMRANATYVGSGSGDGRVRVLWGEQPVAITTAPESNLGTWTWVECTATASTTLSRILFENVGRGIEVDAFSVVAQDEPPNIVRQPVSSSVINGGTAEFVVGASGSAPMACRWFFNGVPRSVGDSPVFALGPVSTNDAGNYFAIVSNAFGMATSAPVTLTVEAPNQPVILWQPYGDTVGVGGAYSFSVVAVGTPVLTFQWFKDGFEIAGATNPVLTFASIGYTNAGSYSVRIQNNAGAVWSLNARLVVTGVIDLCGTVVFANQNQAVSNINAPVFEIDGVTRLNGSNFLAQLYGGPSLEMIRPVGVPSKFKSGFEAGYFCSQIVTLPTVPPGSNAVLQVRAWDGSKGSSYEEARALGGRFGKSVMFTIQAGGAERPPAPLEGLNSFSLQAGRSQFATGEILFVSRQPGDATVWAHQGEPGFRYLIEKSNLGFEWRPFVIVTNTTSTVTFTDAADIEPGVVFYRSRILD
jgi:hypothetical protein